MPIEDDHLVNIMQQNIYAHEKDNYGHAYVIIKEFTPNIYNKKQKEMLMQFIVDVVKKSLALSQKYNKKTSYVHLYLTNCNRRNFNLAWFKKVNHILTNTFEDTLESLYLYSDSNLFSNLWKLVKNFIDKDTREKIVLIKC
jgi:hypothetical protein|tara:strand:- start:573 stop:995 length:423 start_codon:yes stop_codon:yes gene_type:complete